MNKKSNFLIKDLCMKEKWLKNWEKTRQKTGWKEITKCVFQDYQKIGFMCGLEVHQQLKTEKKLFCRCKSGVYHDFNDYDAEIIRHMRPTLSELGEYDGTALMEFKTKKEITYRINNDTACTYETDDTPPFEINKQALEYALRIAHLLKINIVGELHITRKQYLDGSIPTGFQRTAIIGIEGNIPITNKNIRVIQFSIEEDSCREVSDIGHKRVYFADRLGTPLVETVTYPDMLTPYEAAEACQNIRFIARSSGVVRTGIGAARQDVNVSVKGGTRVEIKGVAHIKWIPKLTHNEAFRQKALLLIKDELLERCPDYTNWSISHKELKTIDLTHLDISQKTIEKHFSEVVNDKKYKLIAVNLPNFLNILSFFTQPNRTFADEISDRLKVIACIEKPNMIHSEYIKFDNDETFLKYLYKELNWKELKKILNAEESDAQLIFWALESDIEVALETIEERARMAFTGVPNETRKSLKNGTTVFERVLPGPDRMYPDTDSKPVSINESFIDLTRQDLPLSLSDRFSQLKEWGVPNDSYVFILRNNLMPLINRISEEYAINHSKIALLYAHYIKNLIGKYNLGFDFEIVYDLCNFIKVREIEFDLIYEMIEVLFKNPNMVFESILSVLDFEKYDQNEIFNQVQILSEMYDSLPRISISINAKRKWIMGELYKMAVGNISLSKLSDYVLKEISNDKESNNA